MTTNLFTAHLLNIKSDCEDSQTKQSLFDLVTIIKERGIDTEINSISFDDMLFCLWQIVLSCTDVTTQLELRELHQEVSKDGLEEEQAHV